MAQYAVSPEILHPHVPAGTELDLHDGKAYVSLVAFEFRDTAVRGVKIPGHVNFVEVNLRFYVRHLVGGEWRRGAVFIAEFVPRRAIALVANVLYGEPYRVWSTSVTNTETPNGEDRTVYEWWRRDQACAMALELGPSLGVPPADSHASFIIEHYWGYTRRSPERTDEYRVTHPQWSVREVRDARIEADFGRLYGEPFAVLNGRAPDSVVFAEGSEVTVAPGTRLNLEAARFQTP